MNSKINIIITDDHFLIREGLCKIISLEENMNIISNCSSAKELFDILENNNNTPDVILLDINMPGENGLETLKKIKDNYKNIKVIMLTVENDKKTIKNALQIGTDGYILKESAGSEIVTAINSVVKNNIHIDKNLLKIISYDVTVKNTKDIAIVLNKKEIEILYHIANGLTNKEISEKIDLAEKTVKNYCWEIFKKINVKNRVDASIFAFKNDIENVYLESKNIKKY